MFDLPGLDSVEQVVIGPEVVDGKSRPLYIHAERAEKSATSA
jgi:ATP-dependent Clp protease ATP-binding subunit ClpX